MTSIARWLSAARRGRGRRPQGSGVVPTRQASPLGREAGAAPDSPPRHLPSAPLAEPVAAPGDPVVARARIPREIWVLVVAAFVIALGFGLVAPVLPQFARSFDVGVAAASVIVSVFALMRLVFAPAGGVLISRLGERPVYLLGLLIVALSTGACAFAGSYGQLLVFRGLGGVGSTMFTVSAMALVVRLAPPTIRGRVSSAYSTAFLVGNIGGPVLGSLMAGFGYRVPFLVYAVTLLVAAAVVARFLRGAALRPDPAVPPLPGMTLAQAWSDSAYRAALVSGFANGWSAFGVRVALVPLFAAAVPSLGPALAGVSLTVFAVGNTLGNNVSGRIVDAHGRRPLVLLGLLVNAVGTAVLGWSGSVPMLLGLSLVAGIGTGLLTPGQHAALADIVGTDRNGGRVLSAFQMAQDAGAILGPVLAGWLADRAGYPAAFALTGVISAVACLPWLLARETLVRPVDRDGAPTDGSYHQ